MNFKTTRFLCFILICYSFLYTQQSVKGSRAKENGADYSYSVGPKDLLEIKVFNVPELNITVRVSEDGTITLPLLGNIKVEGLNKENLEQHLVKLLEQKYLKNAQVTVFIKEYQSKIVSIIGALNKPGNFELLGKMTLLELISLAGGLTEKASDRIIIIRKYKNGTSGSLLIDLDELMLKGNPKYNLPLQSGDFINIPIETYLDIYVFGQVKQPGHIKVKQEGEITLLRAIAQAGGFSDRARKSAVLVKRKVNGKEVKIRINVKSILKGKRSDFVLQDNDIIHVPESVL